MLKIIVSGKMLNVIEWGSFKCVVIPVDSMMCYVVLIQIGLRCLLSTCGVPFVSVGCFRLFEAWKFGDNSSSTFIYFILNWNLCQ